MNGSSTTVVRLLGHPESVRRPRRPTSTSARRRRPRIRRGRAAWRRRGRRTCRRSTSHGRRSRHTTGRRCRARHSGRRRARARPRPPRRSQKSAPLSGGPPSPNVLVTIRTSRAAASGDSGTSSMLTSCESPQPAGQPCLRSPRRCRSATPTAPAGRRPSPTTVCRSPRAGAGPTGLRAHRAHLELGLQGVGVDGVVGQRVDGQVLAVFVVPVERHEAVALSHPVGHHGGQHRATAARRQLDRLAVGDVQRGRVEGMEFDERVRCRAC